MPPTRRHRYWDGLRSCEEICRRVCRGIARPIPPLNGHSGSGVIASEPLQAWARAYGGTPAPLSTADVARLGVLELVGAGLQHAHIPVAMETSSTPRQTPHRSRWLVPHMDAAVKAAFLLSSSSARAASGDWNSALLSLHKSQVSGKACCAGHFACCIPTGVLTVLFGTLWPCSGL